jgi:cytochrome P450
VINNVFARVAAFGKYPKLHLDNIKLQALIGRGMLATHTDERWKAHRQSVARNFTPQFVVQHYRSIITRNLDQLFGELRVPVGGSDVNMNRQTILFSGRIVSEILSPFHAVDDAEFMQIKRILDTSILEFHKRDFTRRAKPYREVLLEIVARLYQSYLDHQHEDAFSLTAVMHQHALQTAPGEVHERVLDQLLNIIVAGFETTSTTMNWIAYMLASHPAIAEQLYEQLSAVAPEGDPTDEQVKRLPLVDDVIAETMRLYSVLWFNIRQCLETTTVDGYRFVKGARIMALPYLANRQPRYYQSPAEFNPHRFAAGEPRPVHPFGHGPRVCIGKPLAEMELRLFTCRLVRSFRLARVNQPRAIGGVLLQPHEDIVVRLTARADRPAFPVETSFAQRGDADVTYDGAHVV